MVSADMVDGILQKKLHMHRSMESYGWYSVLNFIVVYRIYA